MSSKNILEQMTEYLQRCPICKLHTRWQAEPPKWFFLKGSQFSGEPIWNCMLKCSVCGMTFLSSDWYEEEGERHVLKFLACGSSKDYQGIAKGLTLVGQCHSVLFWQNVDIDEIESSEDRRVTLLQNNASIKEMLEKIKRLRPHERQRYESKRREERQRQILEKQEKLVKKGIRHYTD